MSTLNIREAIEKHPTLSINTIINTLSRSEVIYFPAGKYPITENISIPHWVTCIYGDGIDTTILSVASDNIIDHKNPIILAERGQWKYIHNSIRSNLSRFDSQITLEEPLNSEECQPGDILMLHNTSKTSYADFSDATRCNQTRDLYAGELLKVAKIENDRTKIQLAGTIQGYYDLQRPSLTLKYCRGAKSLTLRDLSFIGSKQNVNEIGIQVKSGENVIIQRVGIEGSYKTGLEILSCLNVLVSELFVDLTSGIDIATSGDAYGMAISDSQNVRVSTSNLTGLTHAITIGSSGGDTAIISRQILVDGCHLTTHRAGYGVALDSHSVGELYTFSNNTCFGGISIGGRLGRVIGNDIYAKPGEPCLVAFEMVDAEHDIVNNRFHGTSYGGTQGIMLFGFYAAVSPNAGPLRIIDNRVVCTDGTTGHAIKFSKPNNNTGEYKVLIQGNYIYTKSVGDALFLEGFTDESIISMNNLTRHCKIKNGNEV